MSPSLRSDGMAASILGGISSFMTEGRPMRIAMVTTFFGPHRFGGDAAYVERLAQALLRRGHSVTVFYSRTAFEALRGKCDALSYRPPPGLEITPLWSRWFRLDLLWRHQTGRLGHQGKDLVRRLVAGAFDVIHFHNISLIGGAALLNGAPKGSIRLMTAHEHWLTCPLSLLWRLGLEACERATCVRCTLHSGRPPQLWRHSGAIQRGVAGLDSLIFPSHHTLESHAHRGIRHPRSRVLPYFLPDDWVSHTPPPSPPRDAPFRFVGRLVKEKGLQTLIPLFLTRPECRLEILGDGPFRPELERLATGAPNIRFLGAVSAEEVRALLPNTRALLVPSLFPETFGYVLLEAWSQGIPTLSSAAGALAEVSAYGGGWVCHSREDFAGWIDLLRANPATAQEQGLAGWRQALQRFGEGPHIRAWESLARKSDDVESAS